MLITGLWWNTNSASHVCYTPVQHPYCVQYGHIFWGYWAGQSVSLSNTLLKFQRYLLALCTCICMICGISFWQRLSWFVCQSPLFQHPSPPPTLFSQCWCWSERSLRVLKHLVNVRERLWFWLNVKLQSVMCKCFGLTEIRHNVCLQQNLE